MRELAPPQQIIIKQWCYRLFHASKAILQECETLIKARLCVWLGGDCTPVAQRCMRSTLIASGG